MKIKFFTILTLLLLCSKVFAGWIAVDRVFHHIDADFNCQTENITRYIDGNAYGAGLGGSTYFEGPEIPGHKRLFIASPPFPWNYGPECWEFIVEDPPDTDIVNRKFTYYTYMQEPVYDGDEAFCEDYDWSYPCKYLKHYFYTYDDEEDCCIDEEDSECCDNKECPDTKAGNPFGIWDRVNYEKETDLTFNSPFEMGFKLYRKYKSRPSLDSTIGFGWRHNFNVTLEHYGPANPYGVDEAYLILDESMNRHTFIDFDGSGTYIGISSKNGSLTREPDQSFKWCRPNGICYIFNQQLQYIEKIDNYGNSQSLTYYANGLLQSVTDQATGRSIGFVYNAEGRIDHVTGPTTATIPDGVWATYQYDTEGNLRYVIYADDENGSASSGFEYRYEDANNIHSITEKRNLAGEFLSSWEYYPDYGSVIENITRDGKGATIISGGWDKVIADAHGVERTYGYEGVKGRISLTNVTGGGCASCGGGVVRYGYDSQNRVNEVEYASGRIDQYADFNIYDRYTTEIQAVGTPNERTIRYALHPSTGDRLSIIESSIMGIGDKETIFDYDDDGNAIPNENPTPLMYRKIERGYTQDATGTQVAFEYITTYAYDAKGNLEEIDGPLPGDQDKISYTYDPVTGDQLTETRPLVGTTSYTYDAAGNVATITEPNGTATTMAYDGRNRQISTTRSGVTTSRTYTAAGELATNTDALNRTMNYTYNSAGFVEKIIDPSGNFVYHGYNTIGQQEEQSIHAPDETMTHYGRTDFGDPANNPDLASGKPWKSIRRNHEDTADLETVYTYDNTGNIETVTDAKGNITTYSYDAFNRLQQVVQPDDTTTTYSYDVQSNLASVTDAEGLVTTYSYDDLGRLVQTVSPDTGTTTYSYDENGNVLFKTQNGNPIEYRYDLLNRLTHIIYTDPTQNVNMSYDSGPGNNLLGRLSMVTDPGGTVQYSYDSNGNLESETRTINGVVFVTGYGYDDAGNLRLIAYPTGQTVTYVPDNTDPALIREVRLDPHGANQALANDIAYQPFGPMSGMTLGNGAQVSKSFDLNYQIIDLYNANGTTMLDCSYTPDNVGNIETITDRLDPTRSQSFGYDDLYRLTSAVGNYGTINYTYDRVGNRTGRSHDTDQDSYAYDPANNRIQSITGSHPETFTHDNNGSIITRTSGNTQTTYDYYTGTQRLQTATIDPQPDGSDPASYTYNSSGQRISATNSNPTIFHYDLNGLLIAETTTDGYPIKSYVWLHGQPLAMIKHQPGLCPGDLDNDSTVDGIDLAELAAMFGTACTGCAADIGQDGQVSTSDLALLVSRLGDEKCSLSSIYYYHNDHLGTPQKISDSSANIVWDAHYLPFGDANVTLDAVENNLRFLGQYYDQETGLHYNYHRYYYPKLGRYLRADPIGIRGGINLYAYVNANPVNRTDRKGLYDESDFWEDGWTGERGDEYYDYEEECWRAIKAEAKASGKCLVCTAVCTGSVLIGSEIEDTAVQGIVNSANRRAKKAAAKLAARMLKKGIPVYNAYSTVQDARGVFNCVVNCAESK